MRTLRFNDTTVRYAGKWEIETYRSRHAAVGLTVTIDGPGGERCLSVRASAGRRVVAIARVGWSNLYPWVPVYRRAFGWNARTTGFQAPYVGAWISVWLLANRDAHTTSRRFGRPGRRRTMRPEGGFEWNAPGAQRRVARIRRDVQAAPTDAQIERAAIAAYEWYRDDDEGIPVGWDYLTGLRQHRWRDRIRAALIAAAEEDTDA